MDLLYSGSSGADRGTLFHIRNTYNHRNVTKSVNTSFNPLVDLLSFATEGLVALLAMKVCNMKEICDKPQDLPSDINEQNDYLLMLAKKIVGTVWNQVDMQSINEVIDADDEDDEEGYFEYCICKDGMSLSYYAIVIVYLACDRKKGICFSS